MKIEPRSLECVNDRERALALLHPLRRSILADCRREPASATEIASRLGLARQKVNYHVRQLADAGLLVKAERRRKRNMHEQRYAATARAYALSPEVLGTLGPERGTILDRFSAAHLFALSTQLQGELGRAMNEASEQEQRVSTLSVATEMRFENAEQRVEFGRALERAVIDVVGRFSSAFAREDGSPAPGRPYRLMVGAWPIPPEETSTSPTEEDQAK
jgi:DNA-binding transcriptional ArsR family regulator